MEGANTLYSRGHIGWFRRGNCLLEVKYNTSATIALSAPQIRQIVLSMEQLSPPEKLAENKDTRGPTTSISEQLNAIERA